MKAITKRLIIPDKEALRIAEEELERLLKDYNRQTNEWRYTLPRIVRGSVELETVALDRFAGLTVAVVRARSIDSEEPFTVLGKAERYHRDEQNDVVAIQVAIGNVLKNLQRRMERVTE